MSAVGAVRIRRPAVAGAFYPARPDDLSVAITAAYDDACRPPAGIHRPVALVVPHAGYVYSGAIAASGYQLLRGDTTRVQRVVLLGPSHRVPLNGLAVSSADAFATPFGLVPVDVETRDRALTHNAVGMSDLVHEGEHSMEVQLPFLQTALPDVPVLPIAVGRCSPEAVADVLDLVWTEPTTIVVVSTDLSHYLEYGAAVVRDQRTAQAVVAANGEAISTDDACGGYPLRGLLETTRRRGLGVTLLDLRNSGDTAGDRDRVVGYGAFAIN